MTGMGVCLVVVIGCTCFIDKALKSMGNEPEHVNGYRVTSDNALQAAIDAAGRARVKVEGFFSKVNGLKSYVPLKPSCNRLLCPGNPLQIV